MTDRHTFQVRSRRTVYPGKIMALRIDEVSMPGGGHADREVVEHPGAVAVVPIDDDGQVVLVHQYRHPRGRRLWELPAGLLDVAGEDPALTAGRELAEETGLAARDWAVLVDLVPSPGLSDEAVRVYLARGLTEADRGPDPGDEEADLVVRRFPLADAVRLVVTGEIVNAIAVSGILAAHLVCSGQARPRPLNAPWQDRPTAWAARAASR